MKKKNQNIPSKFKKARILTNKRIEFGQPVEEKVKQREE